MAIKIDLTKFCRRWSEKKVKKSENVINFNFFVGVWEEKFTLLAQGEQSCNNNNNKSKCELKLQIEQFSSQNW